MITSSTWFDRLLGAIAWPSLIHVDEDDFISKKDQKKILQRQIDVKMRLHLTKFAEKQLCQLLELDSDNAPVLNALGVINAKRGNLRVATKLFLAAQKIRSHHAVLHNLGLAYYYQGHYGNSLKYFKQAAEKSNDKAADFFAVAHVSLQLKHDKEAIEALYEAVKADKTIKSLVVLHMTLTEMNRTEEAEEVMQQLKQRSKVIRALSSRNSSDESTVLGKQYLYCRV
jgi:tetratricopeptide (TPR) repeat protein